MNNCGYQYNMSNLSIVKGRCYSGLGVYIVKLLLVVP